MIYKKALTVFLIVFHLTTSFALLLEIHDINGELQSITDHNAMLQSKISYIEELLDIKDE